MSFPPVLQTGVDSLHQEVHHPTIGWVTDKQHLNRYVQQVRPRKEPVHVLSRRTITCVYDALPSCPSYSPVAEDVPLTDGNSHLVARQPPSNHTSCCQNSWDTGPPTDLRDRRDKDRWDGLTVTGSSHLTVSDFRPGACPELQVWSGLWDLMKGWRPQAWPGWTSRLQSWNQNRQNRSQMHFTGKTGRRWETEHVLCLMFVLLSPTKVQNVLTAVPFLRTWTFAGISERADVCWYTRVRLDVVWSVEQ